MLSLKDSAEELHLMKPKALKALTRLGIKNIIDLLYYFPRDWQDLSDIKTISQVQPNEKANLRATLKSLGESRSRWRRIHVLNALFEDQTGSIAAIWFNQPYVRYNLKIGREYYLSGKVYLKDTVQLQNPTCELVKDETIHTAGIVPVYELTDGVTLKQMRYWLKQAVFLSKKIPDLLPQAIRKKLEFPDIDEALQNIHFPESPKALETARERLAFEELFLFQLALLSFKSKLQALPAPQISFDLPLVRNFVSTLPFRLTHSQRQAIWEILKDLGLTHPMNRLLEGEVGSGKTVVAGIAMLEVANSGYQSVLLAPTEILAWQHYQTLRKLFKNTDLEIAILTRSHKILQKPEVRGQRSDDGNQNQASATRHPRSDIRAQIIIGTHALLQERAKFEKIGLLVVDEQHRFGVKQRAHLTKGQRGLVPHLLSMTATPIPRTLALAFYGDLDISELRELPVGRKKIVTRLVSRDKRPAAYEFMRKELLRGRQIYVVTPLIEESNPSLPLPSLGEGIKAAVAEAENLKKIFPEFQIALLHGRMPGEEKKQIMQDFKSQNTQILVSTSIIEVGVDIPNASVMVIENAERFGLSQLHQLRGRVGRGEHQSYCLLFAENVSEYTTERLMAVVKSNDGFELAEKDLELRGSGEIMGQRQSGFIPFKIAKLSDKKLIKLARKEAESLLSANPNLEKYPLLKQKAEQIAKNAHLE